jgi:hypothetical protein
VKSIDILLSDQLFDDFTMTIQETTSSAEMKMKTINHFKRNEDQDEHEDEDEDEGGQPIQER